MHDVYAHGLQQSLALQLVNVVYRVSDQVRVCNWQDLRQQEEAVAELQAFCSASIKGLGLQSFSPLLLKGAVASWPAVDKWSLDWLVEQYGEQR